MENETIQNLPQEGNGEKYEGGLVDRVEKILVTPVEGFGDNIENLNESIVIGEPININGPVVDTTVEISEVIEESSIADQIIFRAIQKVKEHFFSSKLNEQKLAEFMYRMLSLAENDEVKINSDFLEEIVNEMLEGENHEDEVDSFNRVIDKLMGEDSAKTIYNTLTTEKVDEIVEKLLGEDTKKLLCEKLQSNNLDDLLNKLVDEKLNMESDPCAQHPVFDEFIEKILGKDVEDFIKKRFSTALIAKPSENAKIPEQL